MSAADILLPGLFPAFPAAALGLLPMDNVDALEFVVNPCPLFPGADPPDFDGVGLGPCVGTPDNCPVTFNPGQEDTDGDFLGDVCDPCTDVDGDGFGNPGFPGNLCALDNCPFAFNPPQTDTDGDGIGDACDTCTDSDGDGFGDPGFPGNLCPPDNCPFASNPTQADSDGDGLGDACDPEYNCTSAPAGGCFTAPFSLLKIRDKDADGGGLKDKLDWKWKLGPPLAPSAFGDPTTTTDYALCIYTGTAAVLALEVNVPAGANWLQTGSGYYKYSDPMLAADGTKKAHLRSNDAASKIQLQGKDENLPLQPSTLPLDASAGILVQLRNSDNANCWEASFPFGSVTLNTEESFKAKIP